MNVLEVLSAVEIISKDSSKLKNELMNIDIEKIAYHSMEVTTGTLFVCIRGYQTDGHNYAKSAVEEGANAIIVEEFIEGIDVPQIKVANSRIALAVIASNFYDQPSKDLRLFGVTGTNGKTTITYMVDKLLADHGIKTGLIGTVMIKINDTAEESVLTTPESADLQRYLAKMRDEKVSHVSMEVSSSALDLKRVAETHFDIVAFTNISHDHIDLHGSFQNYFDAKASLIRNASKNSIALLNVDEPLLLPLIHQTEAEVVTFGIDNTSGTVYISDIDLSTGKPSFTVNITRPLQTLSGMKISPMSFRIDLNIPGYHSIYNATTAILTALLNDVPAEVIIRGMSEFEGVERRFHILYDKEFTVIDDLMLNANNVSSCFDAIEELDYDTLHVVHAIRGSNGTELNKNNAETMAIRLRQLGIDKIILTTSRSHVRDKDQVLEDELDIFLSVMKESDIKVDLFEELEEALSLGLQGIKHNDLLLISGARGMDHGARLCLELMKKMYPYVDKEVISSVLNKKIVGMKPVSQVQ